MEGERELNIMEEREKMKKGHINRVRVRRETNRDIGKGRKKKRVKESSRERMRGDGR